MMVQHTYPYLKHFRLWSMVFIGTLAASCSKDKDRLSDYDNNKINLLIADNFNLSAFSAVLERSKLGIALQNGKGPYTALAPSDQAFSNAGYNGRIGVLTADPAVVSRIANYHTLDGKYELNKLPFVFNQELRSRAGKLYATHWVKGNDTVLTINGSRVLSQNIPSSNGIIQVLNRVLKPYLHDFLGDAINAESSITLFAQALKTSGMLENLNSTGPYTVFAPTNAAMNAFGYQTLEQVKATDPEQIRQLVSYHIVKDRRFIYDYILSTGPSNTSKQAMLDGNSVNILLNADQNAPGSFTGIRLRGIGNTADLDLVLQDQLAGNGVLHIINGVLRITQ